MDEPRRALLDRLSEVVKTARTEPQRQYGGPESGLPPPFVIGSELAPYLIVGIDFASTACRVSTFVDGQPYVLRPHEFPTTAEFAANYRRNDGAGHSLKSHIGSPTLFSLRGTTLSTDLLCANILSKLKYEIESTYQRMLAKAVLIVPAGFTHNQRQAIWNTAAEAGIGVLSLLNEPSALALSAMHANQLMNGYYLTVSGGASTFECSLIHLQNKLLETKAIRCSKSLSGHHLTDAYANYICNMFATEKTVPVRLAAEKLKRELDHAESASVSIGRSQIVAFRETVSPHLEQFTSACRQLVSDVLSDAGVEPRQVSGVITGGGTVHLWTFKDWLHQSMPRAFEYESCAVLGAAIQAALIVRQEKDWVVWDALAHSVCVAQGARIREIVAVNSPLPISGHRPIRPADDGSLTAKVLQRRQDSENELCTIANVQIDGALQNTDGSAEVDIAVNIDSNGLVSFCARQHVLGTTLVATPIPSDEGAKSVIPLDSDHAHERDQSPNPNEELDTFPLARAIETGDYEAVMNLLNLLKRMGAGEEQIEHWQRIIAKRFGKP